VLAVEAGKTILVDDADELAEFALRSGISVVSFYDEAGRPALDAEAMAA